MSSPARVSAEGAKPVSPRPTVIVISLDGTRPVDLENSNFSAIARLGRLGARAEGLVPVNPPNTFPSHVSMATGVHPEEHRLVGNSFIDPGRGRFDRDDAHLWIEAEPIWSIAERNGIPTAAYYWVGSEGATEVGRAPQHWKKFSSRTTEKRKVAQILKWLDLKDPKERPGLIMTWFRGADHASHVSGAAADAIGRALAPQNTAIERLVAGIEKRGLWPTTTLLFVADHGMAAAETRVRLSSMLGRARLGVSILGTGGFASIVFKPGRKNPERLAKALRIARDAGLEAWPRETAPASWHVDDPRFGDIVVRAPIGTAIVTPFTLIDGFHGYDPEAPEMAGLFVAYGQGVGEGVRLEEISSLSIAPTILRWLGLEVPDRMKAPALDDLLRGQKKGAAAAQVGLPNDAAVAAGASQEKKDTSAR